VLESARSAEREAERAAAGLFVSLLGLGLNFAAMESAQSVALPCMGAGLGGIVVTQWICARARARQRAELMQGIDRGIQERLQCALEEVGRHDEARSRAALAKATAEYETSMSLDRSKDLRPLDEVKT
jgi:hypothetical protein